MEEDKKEIPKQENPVADAKQSESKEEPQTTEHEEQMEDGLKSIYVEGDGEMPDLSVLDKKEGSKFRRMLIATIVILLVISGLAWAGFFLFSRGLFQDNEVLATAIEGPTSVEAGEEVTYIIEYHNDGKVPIAALEMKMNLPIGFDLRSANPEPTEDLTWNIGSVTPGSDGKIELTGVFRAEINSVQTLQGHFRYRPANFSSDFEDIATFQVAIDASILDISVDGPEKALAGDDIEYVINIQNTGDTAIANMIVTAEIPEDFTVSSSEPEATSEDKAEWLLGLLEPGELSAIILKGQYTSTATGEQTVKAKLELLEAGGVRLAQSNAETLTDVLGGTIIFHLIADGSSEDTTIELGETLLISIDYANQGNEAIENLRFTLDLEASADLPIDWEAVELEEGVRSGNTLVWDKDIIPTFASVQPGQEGVIDLSLPILEEIDLGSVADAFSLALTADLTKIGSVESPREIKSSPIQIAVNSDVQIFATARYFDDEGTELGSGPLPPIVDETTKYRLFWIVNNSLHELQDIRMTTNLPPDVSWTGASNTDIGEITFNTTTRLVTWTIDKLPTDITEAVASFDVAITPDENDVGAFFKLTNATSLTAKDAKTKDGLSRAQDIVTTELPEDEGASGKGVVLEE